MSKLSRFELLNNARRIYPSLRTKAEKSHYIEKLMEVTGYKSSKSVIRHLNKRAAPRKKKKRGRKYSLRPGDFSLLKELWLLMDQPCGKRLAAMLPEWINQGESQRWEGSSKKLSRILSVSSATLDRALSSFKAQGAGRKKQGSIGALKASIPLIDTQQRITKPGQLYADTVAHCGGSMHGSFVWTLTLTDDYTQWTLTRAVWNKGQHGVLAAFEKLFREIPFGIKGINTDNGSEFINYHLQGEFRKKHKTYQITRSRPMHKNDNARAEEKNRHKVRELIGYDRFDEESYVELFNEIYEASNLLNNHFSACQRVVSKKREGGKVKKRYDQARTPYQRVMESLPETRKKEQLRQRHQQLDPFVLRRQIEEGLRKLYAHKQDLEESRGLLAPLTPRQRSTLHPGEYDKNPLPNELLCSTLR